MRKIIAIDKFWRRVDIRIPEACWNWKSSFKSNGYGIIKVNGKTLSAHRMAWEISYGPIPEGMLVLHKCDNSACVNPDHLYLGTYKDNKRDTIERNPAGTGAKLHKGEIELIKILGDNFSCQFVAKMFKVGVRTIHKIRTFDKYLCKEGYYV